MDFEKKLTENFEEYKEAMGPADIFDFEKATLKAGETEAVAVVPLKRQYMIDDFVDLLTEISKVYVLSAKRSRDGRDYEVIMYSMPYQREMYIINLMSYQYGIIDRMAMTFYWSLDSMFHQLRQRLEETDNDDMEILEKDTPATLFARFI